LENFTNMEKQCEGIGQPVSVDLQVRHYIRLTYQFKVYLVCLLFYSKYYILKCTYTIERKYFEKKIPITLRIN